MFITNTPLPSLCSRGGELIIHVHVSDLSSVGVTSWWISCVLAGHADNIRWMMADTCRSSSGVVVML